MSQGRTLETGFIPVREALKNRGPYHAKFRHMRGSKSGGPGTDTPNITDVSLPSGTYSFRDGFTRRVDLDIVAQIGIRIEEEGGEEKVSLFVGKDTIGETDIKREFTKTDLTDGQVSLVPGGVIFKLADEHTIDLRTHVGETGMRSTSIQERKR